MVPRPKDPYPSSLCRRPSCWGVGDQEQIAFLFVLATTALQGPGEAADHAARAYLSQTKLDEKLDVFYRNHVNEHLRNHLGNAAIAARIAAERKLFWRWEF